MRLRALLAMPELRLDLVTGEDGLDRVIRWVVTTDLRDPSRYLSGGELVLTGMVWRTGPADSDLFVSALAKAGVSGLAAGEALTGGVPEDLVDACRRHRLPLFRVREDVSFATITEHVVRRLSTGRAADLTAVLDRHRRLVAGATEGAGLGPILELVARDLGMRCWVLTPTGRVVAGTDPPDPVALAQAFLTAPRLPYVTSPQQPADRHQTSGAQQTGGAQHQPAELDATGAVTLFAINEDSARVADWFLACEGDWIGWPAERRALTAELAAIVALDRVRLDDRLSVEGRLAQELIRLVAAGSGAAETVPRLELIGLDPNASFATVVAGSTALRPGELRTVLREILPRACVGLLDEEAIALVPASTDITSDVDKALQTLAQGLPSGGLSAGVSDVVPLTELRGALEEARYARRMASGRAAPVCVLGHDELATHMLLLASVPDEVRHMFRVRLLDPLRTYDKVHKADLVRTLETFLQESGSWRRTGERLHLHVNSVRYRIQRIEELTGRDLSRLEDRVDFFLALRLG